MDLPEIYEWNSFDQRNRQVSSYRKFIEGIRKKPQWLFFEALQDFRKALKLTGIDLEEIGSSEDELQLFESFSREE